MATIYKRSNAALFDLPIESLCERLGERVVWLDSIFGKCERLTHKDASGREIRTPNWHVKGNEYIRVTPDDRVLKNMAFFVLDDPTAINAVGKYQIPFSLIVWGDMRRISEERNIELVKAQLLKALKFSSPMTGHVQVTEIYERSENVWRGFDMSETQNQFMMQPYFSLRITGRITIDEVCNY